MGEYPVWFLFQCLTASRYSLSEWCPSPVNSFWECLPQPVLLCSLANLCVWHTPVWLHWRHWGTACCHGGHAHLISGRFPRHRHLDEQRKYMSKILTQQLDFFPSCISSPSTSWWPCLVLGVAFIQCSRWRHLQIAVASLKNVFQTDGTIDKIFTGGAGKAGSTVAVNLTNGYKWWRAFKTNVTGLLISQCCS